MSVQIEESWKSYLNDEFAKPYFTQLTSAVRQEYMQTTCYPPGKLIFNAFNLCPFDKVKVVIIGQSGYTDSRFRQSDALGRTGRAAVECLADSAGASGKQS